MENKFINDSIINYCIDNSTPLSGKVMDIYYESLKLNDAHKMIGLLPGCFLRTLLLTKQPRNILEIGTFTGFTLSIFSQYKIKDTKIISIEENINIFNSLISMFETEVSSGILTIINDEGMNFLSGLEENFDLIFIDARKECYYDKIDLLESKLNQKGLLIVDNALAGLSVFNPIKPWQKQTVDFNKKLSEDKRFITMILPIRDGYTISYKI